MNAITKLLTAAAAGAAAMYYLDPATGRRRRAMVRERGAAAGHDVQRLARAQGKRAADRLQGVAAEARAQLDDAPVDDAQLQARIRSRLGRMVGQPGAIEVMVDGGDVVLSGYAAQDEIDALAREVSRMRGVDAVDNRLSSAPPDATH